MLYDIYPNIVEARKLIKLSGFSSDQQACEWMGVHKNYIRDRMIIKTKDGTRSADIANHFILTLRLAFKVHCITKGKLLDTFSSKIKRSKPNSIFKKAKLANIEKEHLLNIGPVNEKTNTWAIRYIELYSFIENNKEIYPFFIADNYTSYMKKIGITIFEYSTLTRIPQPGLSDKKTSHPEYQTKMMELIYKYIMLDGENIDINKPYELDLMEIMWEDKTKYLKERNELALTINNHKQKIKNAKKDGEHEIVKLLELEVDEMKEKVLKLDPLIKYEIDDLAGIFKAANSSYEEIEHYAKCEMKRIIWRGRVLPWSVCFARLLNRYRQAGGVF